MMSGQKSYHHGSLREALLKSAAKFASRSGAIHLTVRELTEDAGVTPPAFYRYFSSIENILEQLRLEGLELLEAAERSFVASSPGEPLDRVSAMIRAYVRFASSYPGHFKIMTDSQVASRPEAEQRDRPAIAMIVDAIRRGQENGTIIAGNPRDLAVGAWAALHGLASLFANGPLRNVVEKRPDRASQIEDSLIAIIERGLQAPVSDAKSREE